MTFLENLQAKDISPKFAENAQAAISEVLVVHYRPRASQKKYL